MSKLVKKFSKSLKDEGFLQTLQKIFRWFVFKINHKLGRSDPIQKRRIFISEKLDEAFHSVIRYGPFREFKFSKSSWWSGYRQGKWILRQIPYKYVPKSLIELPKAGLGILLAAWLRGHCGIG